MQQLTTAQAVERWGNSTSLGILDPNCSIFTLPEVDGIIGYRIHRSSAVVFGDPVCPPENIPVLVHAFQDFCKQHKKSIIYIATSSKFTDWALQNNYPIALSIGNEIILNPTQNALVGSTHRARALRNKYNHSVRIGVTVHEYDGHNPAKEDMLNAVAQAWLKNRVGPQIGLAHVSLFSDREHKRWFYAELDTVIIGVLMLNRINASAGWTVNMLMLQPHAPYGTSEHIIVHVLTLLGQEGCAFFSAGTTTSTSITHIHGLGSISRWLVQKGFKLAQKIFRLSDRQKYWEKFQPQAEPAFVIFSKQHLDPP